MREKEYTRKNYSDYIRKITTNHEQGKKNNCKICNKDNQLQLHHITPVFELSVIAYENEMSKQEIENDLYCETTYLCKEHHKKFHSIADYNFTSKALTVEEFDKYMEMLRQVDLQNVEYYLYKDYDNRINNYLKTVSSNLVNNIDLSYEELEQYVNSIAEIELEIENEEFGACEPCIDEA